MRSNLLHRDAAAVGGREHHLGDPVVAHPPPRVAAPLVLRLRNHGSDGAEEGTVLVLEERLLLCITIHVHTVSRVGLTETHTDTHSLW